MMKFPDTGSIVLEFHALQHSEDEDEFVWLSEGRLVPDEL